MYFRILLISFVFLLFSPIAVFAEEEEKASSSNYAQATATATVGVRIISADDTITANPGDGIVHSDELLLVSYPNSESIVMRPHQRNEKPEESVPLKPLSE